MRYSRLLEENSFSNRRADYVWLLVLVMAFLLVRPPHPGPPVHRRLGQPVQPLTPGPLPAHHHALPLLLPRLCPCVHLVPPQSQCQDEPLWRRDVGVSGTSYTPANDRITAPYLPFCLVAFSWLLQGGFDAALGDIVSRYARDSYMCP
jgi:Derlin-2/3